MNDSVVERYRQLDTCAVSDALDHLNAPGSALGLQALWGRPKLVGRARTVAMREALPGDGGNQRHIATAVIETAGPGEVIVIGNQGRLDVSCWGDILTAAAQARSIDGIVIDGACRDIDAVAEAQFPVYGRGAVMRTARGRIAEQDSDVPIVVAGIVVAPDDIVVADGSGVVFVSAAIAEQVLELAERLDRRQQQMRDAVAGGASVVQVMKDRNFTEAMGAEA